MGLIAPPQPSAERELEPFVRFEKEIAPAAFGSIWLGRLAQGLEVGRLVSVRRFSAGLLSVRTREQLRQSSRVLVELRHPALLKLLSIREDGNELFSVSEHLQSALLYDLRRYLFEIQTPMPVAVVVRIVRDAARAAAVARRLFDERGLYKATRLLHPDSIVVAGFGETLLRDVGVLTEISSDPTALEDPSVLVGLSPEELSGPRVAHPSSEVFSLGVLLWELLANRPVFSRKDVQRAMSSVISQPIPQLDRVERLGLPVPKELVVLVARAIDRDPRRRTPSLVAFADAIDELPPHLLASTDQVGNCIRRLAGPFIAESYQSSGWKIRAKGEELSVEVPSERGADGDGHDWEPETLAARTLLASDVTEITAISEPNPVASPSSEVCGVETTPQVVSPKRPVWVPVLLTLLAVAVLLGLLHQFGIVRSTISIDRSAGRATLSGVAQPRRDSGGAPRSVPQVAPAEPATDGTAQPSPEPSVDEANVVDLDTASPTDAKASTGKVPSKRAVGSTRSRRSASRGTASEHPASDAPPDDHWGI
jgi:hypothetical protein